MTLAIFGFQQELLEYAPAPVKTPFEKKVEWKRVTAAERTPLVSVTCPTCGTALRLKPSVVERGWGRHCSVTCVNEERTRVAKDSARVRISAALASGPMTVKQIAKACGMSKVWVNGYVRGMRKDRLTEAVMRGQECVWSVARVDGISAPGCGAEVAL